MPRPPIVVFDNIIGESIYTTSASNIFSKTNLEAYETAINWLDEKYPDWQSPSAYWE